MMRMLSSTLESLAGSASWSEWSERLTAACDQWIGPEEDREALVSVIADLGGLSSFGSQAVARPGCTFVPPTSYESRDSVT